MKRILVVDDNMMMRKLIINLFHKEGMICNEASNGIEALEKVSAAAFDLVVTDIIMPGMEGIEMIMQIKKEHPEMPIIAISGGKPYYLYLAKKLGIDFVFTKPLNRNDFLTAVNASLNQPVAGRGLAV